MDGLRWHEIDALCSEIDGAVAGLTHHSARLLLDMDPGVDDALALLLAIGCGQVEIVGLGTSCGNVGPRQSALNALKVFDAAGLQVGFPVCAGLDMPLSGWPPGDKPDAEFIHGPGGLGQNCQPDPDPARLSATNAVGLILETYREPSDVVLLVTGPLTNVAEALRREPGIAANIPRIVFMGGAFKVPGNIAPYGEFNVWMDPVAAAEVFASPIPMTVVGLDVALQCPLTLADIEVGLRPEEWKRGKFVRDITSHYMGFYRDNEGFNGCYMHDPLAMAVAIWPELVWTRPYNVQVITARDRALGSAEAGMADAFLGAHDSPVRGMTVIDHRARGNREREPRKDIALAVDSPEFRLRLMRSLRAVCMDSERLPPVTS
ncbi:nucleoside hydrolase [bacterium]|nr:nucleoside hydrolase [bacterium]